MGNTRSEFYEPVSVDLWWNNDQANTSEPEVVQIQPIENQQTINKANEVKMEEIKQEISSLHEKRIRLIADKKKEMDGLRQELARHKKQNEELKEFIREKGYEPPIQDWDVTKVDVSFQTETFEVPGISQESEDLKPNEIELQLGKIKTIKEKNLELQKDIGELQKELQGANSELVAFENERKEYKTHVTALKDIIAVSKQLLLMRENQIKELTQKISEIEASLAERELQTFSEDLRQEYQRQLQNIKQLRALYEERQRADKTERNNLKTQLEEAETSLKAQETKNIELQERVDELEKDNSNKYDTLVNLESQLGFTKAECGELRAELSVINQLFSQILLGFNNGQEIDMDKLIKTLEENHDLLTEIVINEESNELSSALPKVLLDLVSQVNEKITPPDPQEKSNSEQGLALSTIVEESESQTSTQQNSLSSASEIVQNLPKVWKVLTELLSHQSAPVSVLNENIDQGDVDPCYKSVQTPTGPTLVLSVSKTFIRLKNLIVEKKSLEKETMKLKQLNTHLETRLQDQEKRLGLVSHELSKTWHVVGKMQKQHQQLHTQEKILRYELAQKRKLLNELKEELEYCREKWLQAREKNSTTEEQWKQLRSEFASRKNTISEDLNNSVESGYSDERESSSDDEIEDEAESSVGVSSESVPVCSSSSAADDTKLSEGIDMDVEQAGSSIDAEGNSQTILEVIQDKVMEEVELNVDEARNSETILEVVQSKVIEEVEANVDESSHVESNSQTFLEVVQSEFIEEVEATVDESSHVEENSQTILDVILDEVMEEVEPIIDEASVIEGNGQKILKVVKDEIAKIESSTESSGEGSGTSTQVLDDIQTNNDVDQKPELPIASIVDELIKSIENSPDILANKEEAQGNAVFSVEDGPSTSYNCSSLLLVSGIEPNQIQNGISLLELNETNNIVLNTEGKCVLSSSSSTEENPLISEDSIRIIEMESSATLSPNMVDEIFTTPSAIVQMEPPTMNGGIENVDQITDPFPCNQPDENQSTISEGQENIQQANNSPPCNNQPEENISSDLQQIVLNKDGNTEEVHFRETLKTDLVHNQKVQKEAPKTHEEILATREERLKRLEEQAKNLITQTTNTSNRSVEICTKLDDLHEQYGGDQKSRRKDIDDMYKKLEEDILQTIKKTQGGEEYPSTSRQNRSTAETLAAREERLNRLEEQSNALVNQAARTSHKGKEMCSKLDSLHQQYSEISKNQEPEDVSSRMEEEPSTSSTRTPEEILASREERLQQMEEQAQQLVSKARKNSLRNVQFCSKLNKLHDRYGESSDSSDDGADDNNNNADGGQAQDGVETQNEEVSVNNAQLELEPENAPTEEEEL